MGQLDEFSKGLIPLKFPVYEDRQKGITYRGILIVFVFLASVILAGLVAAYINKIAGILVGVISMLILIVNEKTSRETKKIGYLEINDSEIKVQTEQSNQIIPLTEIKKIDYKNCFTTKTGRSITFNVTLKLKSGQECKLHVDKTADIPERPAHFYSAPPTLDSTLELLKNNFKIDIWYDRT